MYTKRILRHSGEVYFIQLERDYRRGEFFCSYWRSGRKLRFRTPNAAKIDQAFELAERTISRCLVGFVPRLKRYDCEPIS